MEALDLIVKKLESMDEKLDRVIEKNHKLDKRVVGLESKAKYIYMIVAAVFASGISYIKAKFFGEA